MTAKHIVADNVFGMSSKLRNESYMNRRWKCCWKCQKDKNPKGGFIKITQGLYKFICKDCMDIKEKNT